MLKNGFLTFCCAFIPGAGQMYQGYMKRGLSLILTACLIGMVSSLLNPVLLLLVVVWMYSFFDTFNLRAQIGAGTAPQDDYLVHINWHDQRMEQFIGLCWTATSWWAGCSSPSVRSSPTRTSS